MGYVGLFPKIKGTLLGANILGTIVCWGLYWGTLMLGNSNFFARAKRSIVQVLLARPFFDCWLPSLDVGEGRMASGFKFQTWDEVLLGRMRDRPSNQEASTSEFVVASQSLTLLLLFVP